MPSIQFRRKEQKNVCLLDKDINNSALSPEEKRKRQTKHALFTFKMHQYFSQLIKIG